MESLAKATPTLEELAQSYSDIQTQLANAQSKINTLKVELVHTKQALATAPIQLACKDSTVPAMPKVKQPEKYTGKESILSWTTHMSSYIQKISDPEAMSIAASYLQETAHE